MFKRAARELLHVLCTSSRLWIARFSLSPWERAGVRDPGILPSARTPHPNPLPAGEGIAPVTTIKDRELLLFLCRLAEHTGLWYPCGSSQADPDTEGGFHEPSARDHHAVRDPAHRAGPLFGGEELPANHGSPGSMDASGGTRRTY